MSDLRLGDVAELLGVSIDTARRLADTKAFPSRRTRGGQRAVRGADFAAYLQRRDTDTDGEVRSRQSARNHLRGIVTAVIKDKAAAQIEVRAGPFRIVSLLTREAADDLSLSPGTLATVVVKATNVGIELTPRARRRRS